MKRSDTCENPGLEKKEWPEEQNTTHWYFPSKEKTSQRKSGLSVVYKATQGALVMIWDRFLWENKFYPLPSFLREGLNSWQANLHPKIHQKTKKGSIPEEPFMYLEHTAWSFPTPPEFLKQHLGSRRWNVALVIRRDHISAQLLICSKSPLAQLGLPFLHFGMGRIVIHLPPSTIHYTLCGFWLTEAITKLVIH